MALIVALGKRLENVYVFSCLRNSQCSEWIALFCSEFNKVI